MKKHIYIILSLFVSINIFSQNSDDAIRYSSNQILGTARSTALGNAMGALGGDYTSIGINPAGIAVYRSSEFVITPSLNITNTDSEYYNTQSSENRYSLPIQQIGYVGTYKPMYSGMNGIMSTHFSIGYSRNNNFKKRSFITANNVMSSLLDEFIYFAGNTNPDYLDSKTHHAYYSYLIDPLDENAIDNSNIKREYMHAFEGVDNNNNIVWGPENGIYQRRIIDEKGYSGDFEIAGGFNVNNTFYFGATIGVPTFNYRQTMQHHEAVEPADNPWTYLENYTFEESLRATGVGINAKFGMIYKPINAIRIGASFHTPTFYEINEGYSYSTILPKGFQEYEIYDSDNYDFSYYMLTPYKFTGSLAYIIGNKGLISVDYELVDYQKAKYSSTEVSHGEVSYFNSINNDIKNSLSQTHNFRVGAEYRATELFTLRAGYSIYQSPYNEDFLNYDDKNQTFSGGFGIKINNMFIDLAYMLRQQQNYYSLYYNPDIHSQDQLPASIKTNRHSISATLGWRF